MEGWNEGELQQRRLAQVAGHDEKRQPPDQVLEQEVRAEHEDGQPEDHDGVDRRGSVAQEEREDGHN
jgi:hypothetical protein